MHTITDCCTTAICPICGEKLNLFRETQMYRCTGCVHTFSRDTINVNNVKENIFAILVPNVPADIVYDLDTTIKNKVRILQNNLGCKTGLTGWNPETGQYCIGFTSERNTPVIPAFDAILACVSPILEEQDKQEMPIINNNNIGGNNSNGNH